MALAKAPQQMKNCSEYSFLLWLNNSLEVTAKISYDWVHITKLISTSRWECTHLRYSPCMSICTLCTEIGTSRLCIVCLWFTNVNLYYVNLKNSLWLSVPVEERERDHSVPQKETCYTARHCYREYSDFFLCGSCSNLCFFCWQNYLIS